MAMRHYKMVVTTKGPVHIGNGETIGKKDYFITNGGIAVLDVPAFVAKLDEKQLDEYSRFLEEDSRSGLQDFLDRHAQLQRAAEGAVAYQIAEKLSRARRGSYQYLDAAACIKDVDGRPYIPGSSVKGVLRNALLATLISKEKGPYKKLFVEQLREWQRGSRMRDAIKGLPLEKRALMEPPDPNHPSADALRDIMRYVSVSDSDSLDTDCLVFAKKFDKFAIGDAGTHKHDMGRAGGADYYSGNDLNIYRESIRPGTTVEFAIDIDERIDAAIGFALDAEGLRKALDHAQNLYKKCFLDSFDLSELEQGKQGQGGASDAADTRCHATYAAGPFAGQRCRNTVLPGSRYCRKHQDQETASQSSAAAGGPESTLYLGGGVGYDAKTIINAVLEDESGRVPAISRILYDQFPTSLDPKLHGDLQRRIRAAKFAPRTMQARYDRRNGRLKKGKDDHRHWQDPQLGVSPHTLKLGKIGGTKYQMGLCTVRFEERRA